jgi:hypothetical protein
VIDDTEVKLFSDGEGEEGKEEGEETEEEEESAGEVSKSEEG